MLDWLSFHQAGSLLRQCNAYGLCMFGDPYYLPQIQRIFLLFAASSLPTRKEIAHFRRALNLELESGALLLLM